MRARRTRAERVADTILAELMDAILERFADATFEVRVSEDGRIYLSVYSYVDDDFVIQDLVAERTVDAMLQHDVRVHVLPRHSSQQFRD
ncbi:MAG TPA: hypothetical protein VFC51_18905 [Chloroflexota bacterium]|nr:hypothetical protein [Chloroflexota bacterium]